MNSQKCRTKALKIAVAVAGVESVALVGEERNEIVVTGERIDAVALASSLRKSVGFTDVVSVADFDGDQNGVLGTDFVHGQGQQLQAIGWTNNGNGNSAGINYGGGYNVGVPNYYHNDNYGYDNRPRYNCQYHD
ncbi:unnamed protein product [Linum tenue]|uniref:Uncharacterized protein n=1 Tax=Linum tenue TaxID=586396 RepID=A0AAV0R739_9ROSI|nr:unnamed protein product [Linum tenue]